MTTLAKQATNVMQIKVGNGQRSMDMTRSWQLKPSRLLFAGSIFHGHAEEMEGNSGMAGAARILAFQKSEYNNRSAPPSLEQNIDGSMQKRLRKISSRTAR